MSQPEFGKMCVFGSFDDSELYSRNRKLIDALTAHCSSVVEVRPRPRTRTESNQAKLSSPVKLLRSGLHLVGNFFSLASQWRVLRDADLYFIPYPAYIDYMFLRLLTLGAPSRVVVVDAFLCLHDTLVLDRKMVAKGGILARLVSWLEGRTLAGSNLVLIDTAQQKQVLLQQYQLEAGKVATVPVGIDESIWYPAPEPPLEDEFKVLFWGTFIPLHGVETIVSAAYSLQKTHPQISFTVIGDGQTAPAVSEQMHRLEVGNVNWLRTLLPASELRKHLLMSHCVLGVFGGSDKAGNVVPYKAHQAMASNKILITRSGPAIEELSSTASEAGLVLVPPADSLALAANIVTVFESYRKLSLSINTRQLYDRSLSNEVISRRIASALASM